jgi:hypothetical protein
MENHAIYSCFSIIFLVIKFIKVGFSIAIFEDTGGYPLLWHLLAELLGTSAFPPGSSGPCAGCAGNAGRESSPCRGASGIAPWRGCGDGGDEWR